MKRWIPILFLFLFWLPGLLFFKAPVQIELEQSFCVPFSSTHILGCDRLGRDHYALFSFGLFITVLVAIPARVFTILLSLLISLIAGFLPKFFKDWIDSLSSVFLSIPSLLVALIVLSIGNANYFAFLLSIALSDWATLYESFEAKIREIQTSGYVQVSRSMGAGPLYIFAHHILPDLKPLIFQLFLTGIPAVIMTVSIFSYLGVDFGTQTFGPGLGEQISFSKDYAHISPLSLLVPIFGIILLVISIQILNFDLGDSRKAEK